MNPQRPGAVNCALNNNPAYKIPEFSRRHRQRGNVLPITTRRQHPAARCRRRAAGMRRGQKCAVNNNRKEENPDAGAPQIVPPITTAHPQRDGEDRRGNVRRIPTARPRRQRLVRQGGIGQKCALNNNPSMADGTPPTARIVLRITMPVRPGRAGKNLKLCGG